MYVHSRNKAFQFCLAGHMSQLKLNITVNCKCMVATIIDSIPLLSMLQYYLNCGRLMCGCIILVLYSVSVNVDFTRNCTMTS